LKADEEDWEDYEDFGGSDEVYADDKEPSGEDEPWYVRVLPHFWWPGALAIVLWCLAAVFLPKPINMYVGAALFLFAFIGGLILEPRREPFPKLGKRGEKRLVLSVAVILAGALTGTLAIFMTPIGEVASPTTGALLFVGMGIMFLGSCFCVITLVER